MTHDEQIRAAQDRVAVLMTEKERAVMAIQDKIYGHWNSYTSSIQALEQGSAAEQARANELKAQRQQGFQDLAAEKNKLEADYNAKLEAEYKKIQDLEAMKEYIKEVERLREEKRKVRDRERD